jgi:ring-1,2-phenylacetyl-CoA epoxidase subunit PaaC
MERTAVDAAIGVDVARLRADWDSIIDSALAEATLRRPASGGYITEGKLGTHSEHLGYLLAEMQSLARTLPQATW